MRKLRLTQFGAPWTSLFVAACGVGGGVPVPVPNDAQSSLAGDGEVGDAAEADAAPGPEGPLSVMEALIADSIVEVTRRLVHPWGGSRVVFALFGSRDADNRVQFNSLFFHPDVWTFKLNAGVRASDAVDDFLANPSAYSMECATVISFIHYAAVREAFRQATGDDALFDERFGDMNVGRLGQGVENDMRAARKTIDGPSRVGDHAYFSNPDVTERARRGGWNGENVIVMGEDLFFGHPFGITSGGEIIDHLNAVRRRDIDHPREASLGGPVYRLDADVLSAMVAEHLAVDDEALVCSPASGVCGGHGDCCEGTYCSSAACCVPPGGGCGEDSDCCSEHMLCVGGSCQVPAECLDVTATCDADSDCCGGLACEPRGFCCWEAGEKYRFSELECCGGTSADGVCD